MLRSRFLLLSASSTLALAGIADRASAQPQPEEAVQGRGADIIVTASKRNERLIDVPASITALGGKQLRDSGALRLEDYQAKVPGLSTTQIAPGYTQLTVRGITTGSAQLSSTVATYFDETPTNSSTATALGSKLTPDPDLLDIDRVEVLRGPQGTLYGANALGGVIRYILARPDLDRAHGAAQVGLMSVSHGETGYLARGALSVPIIQGQLAVRASGFYTRDPGYIDNAATGREDINRSVNKGGRVALEWKPSAGFSASLSSLYQRRQTSGLGAETVDLATLAPVAGRYTMNDPSDLLVRTEYQLHSLTLNADLGFARLTSATGYGRQKSALSSDLSRAFGVALGLPVATTPLTNDLKKFTQELRLASPGGETIDYIVGGYYTHEKAAYAQSVTGFLASGVLAPAPLNALLAATLDSSYEETALFGNVTVNVSDRFNVQLGGRWSHNDQTFREVISGLLYGPLSGSAFDGNSGEDAWTFAVAPRFKITPDTIVYARVAKGFRPGGTNLVPPGAAGLVGATYGSDSLLNYEAGIKASLFDRKLGLDLSLYHIDWKDIQTTANLGGFNYLLNGGRARSRGVEASARWSANGLSLSGNIAYNSAHTRDAMAAVGAVAGDRLPYSPRWSGALNADYEFPLGDSLSASFGGGLRYASTRNAYYSATIPAQVVLPAYTLFDLRASLRKGQYALSVYVQNLTNKRALLLADTTNINPLTQAGTNMVIARPRSMGVTLSAGF
jgi:outer membrane receptor protein involved in Fe transport